MGRPAAWSRTLAVAKDEAILAVALHNDPFAVRAFEGFVVHMHLAWLYLLQARFKHGNVDFRYHDSKSPRRLAYVDGEVKCWELGRCVKERWPVDNEPTRRNIEFFIGLRNKIEHRHLPTESNLALAVSGKTQSLLLNFEQELTATFGREHTLAAKLRFPLFIGTFTTEGERVLKELQANLSTDMKRFLADFAAGLPSDVADSPEYELRLQVTLQRANRAPDALPMKFVNWDDLTDEERKEAELLGRLGKTVVRDRLVPVSGKDLMKPGKVVEAVNAEIPFRFTQTDHVKAYQKHQIRPSRNDSHPERTIQEFCIYDDPSGEYRYTEAWVRRIIKHIKTTEGFEMFVGVVPKPKEAGNEEAQLSDSGSMSVDASFAGDELREEEISRGCE